MRVPTSWSTRDTRRGDGRLQGPRPATPGRSPGSQVRFFPKCPCQRFSGGAGLRPAAACAPFSLLDLPDPGLRLSPLLRPLLELGMGGGAPSLRPAGGDAWTRRPPVPAPLPARVGFLRPRERRAGGPRGAAQPLPESEEHKEKLPPTSKNQRHRGATVIHSVCVKLERTGEEGRVESAIRPQEVED